jgi:predicted ATPase/DNA-binding CsgD family transcriptional regulator
MARPTRRLGNVPSEATTFVGRRRELAELRTKLTTARLVSLVGPGGVGKTRIAIRAAAELGRGFRDGAWFVDLADVRDPGSVCDAAMAALDVRNQTATEPLAVLLSYLHDRELLLVLDNCEHLLDATAQLVRESIRIAPGVRMIATSRELLSVSGEYVVPVPPLDLPSAHADESLGLLRQNEAVMLFAERATAATGRFEVTEDNRASVADLCRRLDGLPLAIELAAVRTRVLGVEQILDRLSDRFAVLAAPSRHALPRHQTLRTTIDWSHDLLDGADQTLLRRLCVFAGRFTLEDVAGVCASDGIPRSHVLELLSSLVDKSLVTKDDAKGLARYRLHETMREYALLKLQEADEVEVVSERCTEYYRSTCQQSGAEARYRTVQWLEWMDLEIDNVRSVLGRCVDRRDLRRGVDLVTALGYYWITRATAEGVRWLDELLAVRGADEDVPAFAHYLRGMLALLQADPAAARPALDRAATAARDTRQVTVVSIALSQRSIAENMAGDRELARGSLDEAETMTAGEDYPARIALLQGRALDGLFIGDVAAARVAASEGAILSEGMGDLYSLEMMRMNQGTAALMAGDLPESRARFTDALHIAQDLDDRIAQYYLLGGLGCHAARSGQARLAAQLLGASETIRTAAAARVIPTLAPLLTEAEESVVPALGVARFRAELDSGKRLSRHAAIGLALGRTAQVAAAAPERAGAELLGKREAEVARLVAEGLSNKQIGARLFISERTVDGHLRNILNKLGFNSRAQIAAWMASSSPHHDAR